MSYLLITSHYVSLKISTENFSHFRSLANSVLVNGIDALQQEQLLVISYAEVNISLNRCLNPAKLSR